MSHGAFVHADRLERQAEAEQGRAKQRELWERRRQWAARHLPDLPTDRVLVSIDMLEFGRCELTTEAIRQRTEAALLRHHGHSAA